MILDIIKPTFTKSNEDDYYIVTGKVLKEELIEKMLNDKKELNL